MRIGRLLAIAVFILALGPRGARTQSPVDSVAVPVIQLWTDRDAYSPGDPATVRIHARDDGYVLVLQADPNGLVHVLFPLAANDDQFMRGAETYVLAGQKEPGTFIVEGPAGKGAVFAAWSAKPFAVATVERGVRVSDFQADMSAIVRQMTDAPFVHDLFVYDVTTRADVAAASMLDYAPCGDGFGTDPYACGAGYGSSDYLGYYGYTPYFYGYGGSGYPYYPPVVTVPPSKYTPKPGGGTPPPSTGYRPRGGSPSSGAPVATAPGSGGAFTGSGFAPTPNWNPVHDAPSARPAPAPSAPPPRYEAPAKSEPTTSAPAPMHITPPGRPPV